MYHKDEFKPKSYKFIYQCNCWKKSVYISITAGELHTPYETNTRLETTSPRDLSRSWIKCTFQIESFMQDMAAINHGVRTYSWPSFSYDSIACFTYMIHKWYLLSSLISPQYADSLCGRLSKSPLLSSGSNLRLGPFLVFRTFLGIMAFLGHLMGTWKTY